MESLAYSDQPDFVDKNDVGADAMISKANYFSVHSQIAFDKCVADSAKPVYHACP